MGDFYKENTGKRCSLPWASVRVISRWNAGTTAGTLQGPQRRMECEMDIESVRWRDPGCPSYP